MDIYSFKLNDYIVYKKHIGKGSFSTIYKCFHKLTKIEYAIKEITIEKNKNKKHIKRELDLMKNLNHPNIIKLHDVIIESTLNNIYFIMEYHKKGDLSIFLNGRALKEKFCKKYMRQLSNGLEYLLQNNILHRDLKPQNILLTDNYNIQITDFGLARKFNKNLMFNTLCGSPMYMAPEIINKRDYNYKSDLWSVGIIMYEMLHGYTPFNVTNFFDLIKFINKNKITINVSISEECNQLLLGLLQINYNKRIEWISFFNNKWFMENEILNEENNLLNISFNNKLPNIQNYNLNENQFCSFIHQSIIENDNYDNHNNHDNLNLLINNSYNSDRDSDSDSSEYLSLDENENVNENVNVNVNVNVNENVNENENVNVNVNDEMNYSNNKSKNLPIINNIIKSSFDYEMVGSTYSIKNNKNNKIEKKGILHKKDYIIINPNYINSISLPIDNSRTKPLTESLKDYLNSSIKIIKSSYNYINNINNNSI